MLSHTSRVTTRNKADQPSEPVKPLSTEVTAALSEAGYRSLQSIQATVQQGTVYLTGTVESWYLKQVSQEVVMRIVGQGRVKNELSVASQATAK